MKKKHKLLIIAPIVLLLVMLLFPARIQYRDGGSIEYKALLYSVTCFHQLPPDDSDEYLTGTKVKIFGFEVYNDFQGID